MMEFTQMSNACSDINHNQHLEELIGQFLITIYPDETCDH